IVELRKAIALDDNCCRLDLIHVYASFGKKDQARRTFEELMARSRRRYLDPFHVGSAYVDLGDADQAFEWFERAYQERSEHLRARIKRPRLEAIRADPRYQTLRTRIAMPP